MHHTRFASRSSRTSPRLLGALLLAVAIGAGCTEDEAAPGEPGGPCRASAEPCVEGYSCVDAVCAVQEADAGTASYSVEVTFPEQRVRADGETPVDFDILVSTVTADGERRPYDVELDGDILLLAIPAGAGRIEPARPTLVQGLGLAAFVPCHRGEDTQCPESAAIQVTRADAPLDPIGESDRFTLVAPDGAADMGRPDMNGM